MRLTVNMFFGVSYVERNRKYLPGNLVDEARLAGPRALYNSCVAHICTARAGAVVHVPNVAG